MTAVRFLLAIALLANLAVMAVTHHVRNTRLRYETGRTHSQIRKQVLDNRTLLLQVAEKRQATHLVQKAEILGIKVQPVESKSLRLAQRR